MQPYQIALIITASIIAFVFLLLFAFAFICEFIAFGRRYDKNPCLKYFTAQDFGLTVEAVTLHKGLKGFIYRKDDISEKQKIIIFCHGMGAGHIAYTTEIACFCNLGYPVLAVDSRGCNFSEGKSIKGMYSGVETVVSAIDFARGLPYEDIVLVGHSWGAYSALCASAKRRVSKVVAISSPATPSKTIKEAAANTISKPFATILKPFWWITNTLRYGVKGNTSAVKSAKKNATPTLIIHGDKDKIVALKNSVYEKAEGANIEKLLVKDKAHNPYNTSNAEKLLAEISDKLGKGDNDFASFDFISATEEDKEVMRAIAEFIER